MTFGSRSPGRRLPAAVGLSAVLALAPGVAGRSSAADVSPPPTREQIRALLRTEITPVGPAAALSAVLRTGGYTLSFEALIPGVADVEWDVVPPVVRPTPRSGRGPW